MKIKEILQWLEIENGTDLFTASLALLCLLLVAAVVVGAWKVVLTG